MHTNENLTNPQVKSSGFSEEHNDFRVSVKTALARRKKTVNWLAKSIKRHRNSVSRAINQGEFPRVQTLIKNRLAL